MEVVAFASSHKNGYNSNRKEGRDILLNNTLRTFYYDYIGIRHMVKNHIDSEAGNPVPSFHGLLFSVGSKGSFYALYHRQDNTYHNLLYTICGALVGMGKTQMSRTKEMVQSCDLNTLGKGSID